MRKLVSLFIAARLYVLAAPWLIFLSGAAMNQAAIIANGGKMPVMVSERGAKTFCFGNDGMSDDVHVVMTGKTKLNWLGDYINLHTTILSPGDLLIELGQMLEKFSGAIWATLIISDVARRRESKTNPDSSHRCPCWLYGS